LLLTVVIIGCIGSALATILAFFLYVRARLANREENPETNPEQHARRIAELDRKEEFYRSLHFITLLVFVTLGVIILVILSNRYN
jgi:hypothetical protein